MFHVLYVNTIIIKNIIKDANLIMTPQVRDVLIKLSNFLFKTIFGIHNEEWNNITRIEDK